MTLRSNQFMADMDTTLGSDEEIIVQWARGGLTTLTSARTTVEFQIGIPIMLPNARLTMRLQAIDPDMSVVHIDPTFLRSVAEELTDVHFVAFLVAPPRSVGALAAWRKTMALVASVVLNPDAAGSSPLLRAEMARLVAIAMLTTFPYDSTERKPGSVGIEPASVRAAVEFVDQNAHLPIKPADIAAAVGLSTRSLQYALRRYRETTPTALLQAVRLERIRGELHAADPKTASVAAIARFWGFVHLGRFAGVYRAQYGESPNESLRRGALPSGSRKALIGPYE
ncbi:MAG: hypothetical protein JWQ19_2248 [Subtercola sp.]|nr:hypothetical protein [Subtercola sp.]